MPRRALNFGPPNSESAPGRSDERSAIRAGPPAGAKPQREAASRPAGPSGPIGTTRPPLPATDLALFGRRQWRQWQLHLQLHLHLHLLLLRPPVMICESPSFAPLATASSGPDSEAGAGRARALWRAYLPYCSVCLKDPSGNKTPTRTVAQRADPLASARGSCCSDWPGGGIFNHAYSGGCVPPSARACFESPARG